MKHVWTDKFVVNVMDSGENYRMDVATVKEEMKHYITSEEYEAGLDR
jgi:hypothetical protein